MLNNNGMIQNNVNKFAVLYRLADLAVIQAVLFLSLAVYRIDYNDSYFVISLVASMSFFLAAESFSLYRSWRAGFFKQIFFYTMLSWSVAALLVLIYLFFSKSSESFSRVAIGLWFLVSFSILISWRLCFSRFLERARKNGYNTRSVVVIGLTNGGKRLIEQILDHPETGYRLKAIYDDRALDRLDSTYHSWVDGSIQTGINKAKMNEFDTVFIALPITAEARIKEILHKLGDTTANVQLVPDLFIYCLMNASMAHVGNVQTISVYDNPMQGISAFLKRAEDIVLSIIILSIIAIPMLIISLGISFSSKGPVLFKQYRYGLGGKKIKVWKFRSMTVTENSETKITQVTKGDARITPFGAFLRRTSLDELPQFFNVLAGDMSVVGPRPHAVAHNELYRKQVDYYMLRHKVKPGITGWAQVNGWRGETDTVDKMDMRIQYDLDYIRNWSIWMDFKIVLFTIFRSFNDKSAY